MQRLRQTSDGGSKATTQIHSGTKDLSRGQLAVPTPSQYNTALLSNLLPGHSYGQPISPNVPMMHSIKSPISQSSVYSNPVPNGINMPVNQSAQHNTINPSDSILASLRNILVNTKNQSTLSIPSSVTPMQTHSAVPPPPPRRTQHQETTIASGYVPATTSSLLASISSRLQQTPQSSTGNPPPPPPRERKSDGSKVPAPHTYVSSYVIYEIALIV